MFVLDTNILSAMMRLDRMPEVAAWMAAQDEDRLYTTAISHAEIFSGLAIMTDGRRRRGLEASTKAIFATAFDGRIPPFDQKSAECYAEIFAARKRAGKPTATTDLMIAAIALAHDASMVTRDIGGFERCGLTLINPWQAS